MSGAEAAAGACGVCFRGAESARLGPALRTAAFLALLRPRALPSPLSLDPPSVVCSWCEAQAARALRLHAALCCAARVHRLLAAGQRGAGDVGEARREAARLAAGGALQHTDVLVVDSSGVQWAPAPAPDALSAGVETVVLDDDDDAPPPGAPPPGDAPPPQLMTPRLVSLLQTTDPSRSITKGPLPPPPPAATSVPAAALLPGGTPLLTRNEAGDTFMLQPALAMPMPALHHHHHLPTTVTTAGQLMALIDNNVYGIANYQPDGVVVQSNVPSNKNKQLSAANRPLASNTNLQSQLSAASNKNRQSSVANNKFAGNANLNTQSASDTSINKQSILTNDSQTQPHIMNDSELDNLLKRKVSEIENNKLMRVSKRAREERYLVNLEMVQDQMRSMDAIDKQSAGSIDNGVVKMPLLKKGKIDWEDKIPVDLISFMDATDPNAVPAPPPPPAAPLGVISSVRSWAEGAVIDLC